MPNNPHAGYNGIDPISHRPYNWNKSIGRFLRTGNFTYRKDGSGHRAGENWGNAKNIDPYSQQRRYSKNSPSFDEGVWFSKHKRKVTDIARRMERGERNIPGSRFIPR